MTISSTTARVAYNGNSSLVTFTVPFYFIADAHLLVTKYVVATGVTTTLALTTDYTVTGAGVLTGGSITCVVAPATGTQIIITRNVPLTQETNYIENDPFPAEVHEQALDKLTMEVQQIDEQVDRSVKMPITSSLTDVELPNFTGKGEYIIRINAAETNLEAVNSVDAALSGTLTPTDGGFIVGDGTDFVVETGATARTSMGLGSIATQSSASVSITGGSITGITDLAVTDGGTGASSAADARTNLGLAIGSNVQAYDGTLTSLAALGTAANKMAYTTGVDTWAEADITAAGRALIDDASTSDQRTTLGLVIGTNVQAYSTNLTDWSSKYVIPGSTTGAYLQLSEGTDNGTNKVTLQAPGNLAADYTLTLPIDDGVLNQVLSTDGSGNLAWVASGGTGTSLTKEITQATHGFAVGDLLYLVSTTYTKAIATSAAAAEVVGIVVSVPDVNTFTIQFGGRVTGLTGLTAGTMYFLSPSTAGAYTATDPTTVGHVSKPVFIADTTTTAYLTLDMRGLIRTSGASSSPLTTKGDIYVYGTGNARLPVGTDTYVLTADSAETTGLKWAAGGGGGGTGTGFTKTVNQSTHGFSVGDLLYMVTTTYTKAIATSAAASEVIGIVSAVADVDNFTLQFGGRVTGLTGLTAGTTYFLSPSSAGLATATEPSTATQVSKPVYVADTTTTAYLILESRGYVIGSTPAVQDNLILLSTATASNSATIDFTGLTSTYYYYKVIIEDYIPVTDNTGLWFRTSADGGSTYDAGASDYSVYGETFRNAGADSLLDADIAQIDLTCTGSSNMGTGTNERANFEVTVYNPSATARCDMTWKGTSLSAAPYSSAYLGQGARVASAAVNAIRFLSSSGNILSGVFKLYGIKG